MRGDGNVSIIEIIVILTQPNSSQAVRKESPPSKPFVKVFTFQYLPLFLPVSSTEGSEQTVGFKTGRVNKLIREKRGIRTFEEDVTYYFFLMVLTLIVEG